jgi:hypothetical protein
LLACRVCISTIWGDADGLVCPNVQTVPPSAGYLKRPQVTKGLMLLVGLLLRRSPFTPATLRGPALNGHPCPSSALAASMPLVPLHAACVQPAPKSRFVVSGLLRHEDQKPQRALRFLDSTPQSLNKQKPVGVSLLTNSVSHSPLMKLNESHREQADCSRAPRGNTFNDALRHPGGGACFQALRPSRNGLTPLV